MMRIYINVLEGNDFNEYIIILHKLVPQIYIDCIIPMKLPSGWSLCN